MKRINLTVESAGQSKKRKVRKASLDDAFKHLKCTYESAVCTRGLRAQKAANAYRSLCTLHPVCSTNTLTPGTACFPITFTVTSPSWALQGSAGAIHVDLVPQDSQSNTADAARAANSNQNAHQPAAAAPARRKRLPFLRDPPSLQLLDGACPAPAKNPLHTADAAAAAAAAAFPSPCTPEEALWLQQPRRGPVATVTATLDSGTDPPAGPPTSAHVPHAAGHSHAGADSRQAAAKTSLKVANSGSSQDPASTAAGLNLSQLEQLLKQRCPSTVIAKQHTIPISYFARMVYGKQGIEAVQMRNLVPQLPTLLQNMRERVAGKARPAAPDLDPSTAAQHTACLLRVLALPEVQAQLESQQQLQQLVQEVTQAQQEFEAQSLSDRQLLRAPEGRVLQSPAQPLNSARAGMVGAGVAGTDLAAGKLPVGRLKGRRGSAQAHQNGGKQPGSTAPLTHGTRLKQTAASAGGASAAAAAAMTRPAAAGAGKKPPMSASQSAADSTTLAQLTDILAAAKGPAAARQMVQPLKILAGLLFGPSCDPGTVPAKPLLLQLDVLAEYLMKSVRKSQGQGALPQQVAMTYVKNAICLMQQPTFRHVLDMSPKDLQEPADTLKAALEEIKGCSSTTPQQHDDDDDAAAVSGPYLIVRKELPGPELLQGSSRQTPAPAAAAAGGACTTQDTFPQQQLQQQSGQAAPTPPAVTTAVPGAMQGPPTEPPTAPVSEALQPLLDLTATAPAAAAAAAAAVKTEPGAQPAAAAPASRSRHRQDTPPAQMPAVLEALRWRPSPLVLQLATDNPQQQQHQQEQQQQGDQTHQEDQLLTPAATGRGPASQHQPVDTLQRQSQAAAAAAGAALLNPGSELHDGPPAAALPLPLAGSGGTAGALSTGTQEDAEPQASDQQQQQQQQQQPRPLSLASLQTRMRSSLTLPLRTLARLMHGVTHNPEDILASDLIKDWDFLEEHLQERIQGRAADAPSMTVPSAASYVTSFAHIVHCLESDGHISQQEAQALTQRAYGARRRWLAAAATQQPAATAAIVQGGSVQVQHAAAGIEGDALPDGGAAQGDVLQQGPQTPPAPKRRKTGRTAAKCTPLKRMHSPGETEPEQQQEQKQLQAEAQVGTTGAATLAAAAAAAAERDDAEAQAQPPRVRRRAMPVAPGPAPEPPAAESPAAAAAAAERSVAAAERLLLLLSSLLLLLLLLLQDIQLLLLLLQTSQKLCLLLPCCRPRAPSQQ